MRHIVVMDESDTKSDHVSTLEHLQGNVTLDTSGILIIKEKSIQYCTSEA